VLEGQLKTDYGDINVKIPITREEGGVFKMRDQDVIMVGAPSGSMEIYETGSKSPWRS
jgi:hypothetical protein